MDEIDFSLSMLLMANSRIPYKNLAETFNMSVNSIHKRIKALVDLGVIQAFKAKLGILNFPGITNILMFGFSDVRNKKQLIDKLGENEFIYNVSLASGKIIYIHAFLRNIGELDSLVSFVRTVGNLKNLTIGIDKDKSFISENDLKIKPPSDLDYLIIDSLKNNSRKSISDIALEVGASTKTIRRHLDHLIGNYLVQFQIDWYPDKTSIILSMIHLELDPNEIISDDEFKNRINSLLGSKILLAWSFSNLPNFKIIFIWTQSMKELQEIDTILLSENFKKIDLMVMFEGKVFSTWIEKFLEDKISNIALKSK